MSELRALAIQTHRPILEFGRPERLGKVLDEVPQLELGATVHATRLLDARQKKRLVTRAARVLLAFRAFDTTSRRIVERLGAFGASLTEHGVVGAWVNAAQPLHHFITRP